MDQVRFGIVGTGVMGKGHAKFITEDQNKDFRLAAVCDVDRARAEETAGKWNVPAFTDAQAMLDSGLVDAIIISTPHYWHPVMAIRAARAGVHVLCEKPVASTVGPARAMVAECRKRRVAMGVMFQHRTRAVMKKMKEMVDAGELGELFRVSMVCSSWYRTQHYYNSGAWRGTWDGEGGGVLLNQAPHNLDLFQWIGGMPKLLTAVVGTRLHKIEVENTANAICQYPKGKIGYIYGTTAEAPGSDQMTVCGDRGTLVAEGSKLRFAELQAPISEHLKGSKENFGRPPMSEWRDVPLEGEAGGSHILVTRAFASHVLRGTPLVATGKEGINELEISNAVYLAGFKNQAVEFPVDAREMEALMDKLVRERSTGRGGNLRAQATAELKKLLGKLPW
jgi:predicted dehydrogenase